jgi:hypothetical protein
MLPVNIGSVFFRFWQYGEWVDVVIDDYLPTRQSRSSYTSSCQIFLPVLRIRIRIRMFLGLLIWIRIH